jgi:hypothetical protein
MPNIRDRARQEYLKKREVMQLELLEARIRDEEELFRGEKLTALEIKEMEKNKLLLQLARERMQTSDKVDGYQVGDECGRG